MENKKYSHSRVECFNTCKRQFKYRYIDKLETLPNNDPQNPLYLGTALHHGIETDIESAIKEYFMSYPIITSQHTYEQIKLEYWIPKVKDLVLSLGDDPIFEYELNIEDFTGFIDLMVKLDNGTYGLYDFKYSNNIDHYLQSPQLSLYKYFVERQLGIKVSKLGFIFIPKVMIRPKKTETENQFINRLHKELTTKKIDVREVNYDENAINIFRSNIKDIETETQFEKTESRLCDFCQYKDYCENGNDLEIIGRKEEINMLPSTQRVNMSVASKKKVWIFGAAYSGKTTFADTAPTPLNLNTDGNVKYVTMPRLAIKDEIQMNGRIVNRTYAWEVFKNAIDDLEKGSDFETIVVDLLEDTYQHCRLYMYNELGIEHESDNSFKAWDMIDTEFTKTLKRLLNLDYNIILISHEDTSKDVTKKTGDKITAIRPNIKEKLANKIAGMVDITARVVVEDDGTRYLSFKQDEIVFGGGRLKGIRANKCELTWNALMKVYEQANETMAHKLEPETVNTTANATVNTTVNTTTQTTLEGNKEPEFVEPKEDVRMVVQQENVVNVENTPVNKPVNNVVNESVSETVNTPVTEPVTETTTPVRRQRKVRA